MKKPVILFLIFFLLSIPLMLWTQPAKSKVDRKARTDIKLKDNEKKGSSVLIKVKNFFKNGKPQIGLDYGPLIPLGDAGTVLGTSFLAFRLSGDIRAYQRWGLDFRGGIATGFYSLTSGVPEITATVNIIPFLLYSKTSYLLNIKPLEKFGNLKPFALISFGGGMVSLNETINENVTGPTNLENSSKSNFEGMFNIGLGTSFLPKALPMMEFELMFQYFLIFEQRNANFLNISIGAIYRI